MKCPRCGLPDTWPNEPCVPLTLTQLHSLRHDWWVRQMKGTEGAWRELGAHEWSTGRKPQ